MVAGVDDDGQPEDRQFHGVSLINAACVLCNGNDRNNNVIKLGRVERCNTNYSDDNNRHSYNGYSSGNRAKVTIVTTMATTTTASTTRLCLHSKVQIGCICPRERDLRKIPSHPLSNRFKEFLSALSGEKYSRKSLPRFAEITDSISSARPSGNSLAEEEKQGLS